MKITRLYKPIILNESSLRGEWWIDDSGMATFADGDIGDYNHAMAAFEAALGISAFEDASAPQMEIMTPLSDEAIAWLRQNDANEEAIEWLKDGSDPRDYAMDHMGWIRVQDHNFQMTKFTDNELSNIVDFLNEELADVDEDELADETITVEEVGNWWTMPISLVLTPGATAEGLKKHIRVR
jgi:hypothetical protein